MSLVGRDAVLAEIDNALARLADGRLRTGSGVVVLSGEPGIGKSRILAELSARADARGFLVLEGRAAEFERDVPFAVFVDALDDYLAAAGPRALSVLAPATVAHLATVFPAVQAPVDDPLSLLQPERYHIHRAVRSLIDTLAGATPLVLVLDDLHWADDASAELFAHLLAHPPAQRVLVATAHRPRQLGERLRAAIDRGDALEIEITALTRQDAGRLMGESVPRDAIDLLYAESGGNPFYLLELARSDPGPSDARRTNGEVPAAVLAAINQEIAALDPDARTFAQGGSVAGDPFLLDTAAAAAGLDTDAALPLVDVLVAGGLLAATEVPRRFRFRHPVVRHAVYQSAGPGWRLGAHRRLIDQLRERGASPVELAHHVAAAAEPGDTDAVEVLLAAGHLLAAHAPALAADHFVTALDLLPHRDPRRVDVLVPLATALSGVGQLQACRRRLDEALALLPPTAAGPRAGLTAFCAAIERLIGEHAAAHSRLVATLDALPTRASPEAATLLVETAVDALWRSDWATMQAWADQACDLASTVGARAVQAQALALLAWSQFGVGRIPAALATLTQAETLVDTLPDVELATHLGATFYLARAAFMLERFESAVRHADRGLALGRATGRGELFLSLLTAKSAGLRMLGRLREADEADRAAIDSARLVNHDQVLALALLDRVASATAAGDLALATSAAREAHELTARLGRSPASVVIGFLYGEVLLATGQPDRCITVMTDGLGSAVGDSFAAGGLANAWSLLARAEAARGQVATAQAWMDRLDALLPTLDPLGLPRAQADYARGHLLLAADDPARAAQAALAAAEAADQIQARIHAGTARLLAARALARAGDRDTAITLLHHTRAQFTEYGATRSHDEAVHELRRLGVRIGRGGRPRTRGNDELNVLSERERAIAELVAHGHTNKEIGAELLISTRTVERHLSHIFGKLDITSRAQLGSTIERARR